MEKRVAAAAEAQKQQGLVLQACGRPGICPAASLPSLPGLGQPGMEQPAPLAIAFMPLERSRRLDYALSRGDELHG